MKDLRIKKPKPKVQEPSPTNNSSRNIKTSKKAWKESKKGFKRRNANEKTLTLVLLLIKSIQPLIKQGLRVIRKIS